MTLGVPMSNIRPVVILLLTFMLATAAPWTCASAGALCDPVEAQA